MLLNSYLAISRESDGKNGVFVGEMLLLVWCLVKKESRQKESARVWYIEGMPPLDEGDEILLCVCL